MASGVFGYVWTHAPGKALFDVANHVSRKISGAIKTNYNGRYGGVYYISGTVTLSPDILVSRKVSLFRDIGAAVCARETWSSPDDGGYAFLGVEYGPWLVVMHGIDDESPLVFDRVYGSPMLF